MTSPSSKLFASAELIPELASRTEAAQCLRHIYTKPASAQDTPPRSNAPDGTVLAAAEGPTSSCQSRSADPPVQIAYSTPLLFHPQIAGFSPSLPPNIPVDPPRFSVNLSTGHYTYPKQNILSNASSPNYPHRTILPPLPIGPTPSQPHQNIPRQSSPFSSAAFDGFKVLREAVPIILVRALVSRLNKDLPVNGSSETHLEYVTPLQGHLLRDVFNSNCHHHLQEFHTPMQKKISALPKTTVVGSFLSGDPKDVKYLQLHVGRKDQIHVHIALNKLCSETGLYTILKGFHLSQHPSWTPEANWAYGDINLEEGDAMIWRGDIPYFLSSGGGGQWLRLTYEWGPTIIDLT